MAGKTEYKNQWQKENCDRILLILKKGQKEIIKNVAQSKNKSLNGFIVELIEEAIKENT